DPRADVDADALGVGFVDREPGVLERELGRGEAEMDEEVRAARLLRVHPVGGGEVLHFRRDARGKRRGIEASDRRDAAHALQEVVPVLGDADPKRRNDAQSWDDDYSLQVTA